MAIIERTGVLADVESLARFQKAGVPASNDFNGQAGKGALCTDTTNGKLYINTGTRAATVWTLVGAQV
jgi:hypothetical protein